LAGNVVVDKVLCYVVRSGELLVMRHTRWIPLEQAHVLQSGQGALIARLLDRRATSDR
jgi:hypothetical protein